MANSEQFNLIYKIQGDSSGVTRELQKTDKAITKVGSNKGLTSLISGLSGVATGSQLNGLTSQLTSASSALGAIPGPAGLAVGAIGLLGTVAVGATVALFGLAKSASDYGSEIFDASEKTGLSAETLSSFKLAADQSSSSLEQVTSGVTKFTKTVGEAALGSEEAAAKLTRLGVDPQKAIKDLDGALGDVFKRIAALPPGVTQSKAAMDAFGKSGADLLPFIKSFNGDLPALIAHAKELGITLSDKDARAADEFGDQMDTLTAQLKAVSYAFGRELMPVFLDASKNISSWLSENKGQIKEWGVRTADTLRGLIGVWNDLTHAAADYFGTVNVQTPDGRTSERSWLGMILGGAGSAYLEMRGAQDRINNDQTVIPDWVKNRRPRTLPGATDSDYLDNIKTQKDAADKARKEREEIAKRDAAAQVTLLTNLYKKTLDIYQYTVDKQTEILKKGGGLPEYVKAVDEALKIAETSSIETLTALNAAESALDAQNKKTTAEREVRDQEQADRDYDRQVKLFDTATKAQEAYAAEEKRRNEDVLKSAKADSDQLIAFNEAVTERAIAQLEYQMATENKTVFEAMVQRQKLENDFLDTRRIQLDLELEHVRGNAEEEKRVLNEIKVLRENIKTKGIKDALEAANVTLADGNAILAEINKKIEQGAKDAKELADELDRAFSSMAKAQEDAARDRSRRTVGSSDAVGALDQLREQFVGEQNTAAIAGIDALAGAFDGLGQAVGAAVEAYVLYGSAGASVRQVTAQILAGIAQQAAIKAIFELAEGFAALAMSFFGVPNAGPSATAHFIAAGMYGAIAGTAAIAGRAVAGDSFKKDRAGTSSGTSASSTSNRSTSTPATITRTNPDAYMSGSQPEITRLAAAVEKLHSRLDSMRPGDVVTVGIRQKPQIIGNQVVEDNKRNSSIGKNLLKGSGIR
jgi:hypothetical protein